MGQKTSVVAAVAETGAETESVKSSQERLTMNRARLRDSFREKCQRMALQRVRVNQGISSSRGGGRRRT
jgi:hypothetical protein